ncbi:MAG TPA: N-6 DNA methylase [Candidatus Obscuribacterales bacterium]
MKNFSETVSNLAALLRESTVLSGSSTQPQSSVSDDAFSSGEEACLLSTVLLLVALRVLDRRALLHVLTRRGNRDCRLDATMSDGDVHWLLNELYHRVCSCAHDGLKAVMPAPHLPKRYLRQALELISATSFEDHKTKELAVGDAHQMFARPQRRIAQTEIQTPNKDLSLKQLVGFTQLYTPDWVVDFLLDNTALIQWSASNNFIEDRSIHRLKQLVLPKASAEKSHSVARMLKAHELTILDPACGAGHFLLGASDLLHKAMVLEGHSGREAAIAISKNIAGTDIDPLAVWAATLSLYLKCVSLDNDFAGSFNRLQHVLRAPSDNGNTLLGTLNKEWSRQSNHPLAEKYDAVVTNPPYIGRKLLSRSLKQRLKRDYPDACQDICTAFIRRCVDFLKPGGRLGLITQSSILYLPSSSRLRKYLLDNCTIDCAIEAGTGVFPFVNGEKADSVLLVITSERVRRQTTFLDLRQSKPKETRLQELIVEGPEGPDWFVRDLSSTSEDMRFSFNYSCPDIVLNLAKSSERLEEHADVRQGLATTDNARFVRLWWDVEPSDIGKVWKPYVKGAGSDSWYSPVLHLVKWGADGAEIKQAVSDSYPYLKGKTHWVVKNEQYYFREGLCFSFVNRHKLSVRHLPPGCIFDVGASAIFAEKPLADFLLGYLNSRLVQALAKVTNPTINFQVGDVRRLPFVNLSEKERAGVASVARACYDIQRRLIHRREFPALDFHLSTDGLDFTATNVDVSFHAYAESIAADTKALKELQERLDGVILQSVCSQRRWSQDEVQRVKEWLEEEDTLMPSATVNPASSDFAARWLCWKVSRLLSSEGAHDRFLFISEGNESQIAPLLGLNQNEHAWLQRTLENSVSTFLIRRLSKLLGRFYKGAPPIAFLTSARKNAAAVVSTAWLRRAASDSKTAFHLGTADGVAPDCAEELISSIRQLIDKVKATPEWSSRSL